ncbi:DUF116 domain-containing protein [Methanobrevibacter sp.]|uniref:DUF116 domain-containing protein n=1 Tax=Methanobrevibacter sp. TaxID=66852 RepID=UPI003890E344
MNNLSGDEIIYPYRLNEDYYANVKAFGDEFLEYSQKFNFKSDEESLEALCIGVYWYLYGSTALDLDSNIHQALSNLAEYRRAFPEDKPFIDDLRGKLLTKFLFKPFEKNNEKLNEENLSMLINFLEATGDYMDQIPHFRNFSHNLDDCLELTKWFCKNSRKYLGEYTFGLNEYLENNGTTHLMQEDVIFYHGHELEYHLNMLGAEIMTRIFKEEFEKRPRKAIILPGCMNSNSKKCRARQDRLGDVCTFCNPNCNAYKISKEYSDYEVYIVSHESTAFKGAKKEDMEELGIVGITCVLNLISGGWKSSNMLIPPQCVLLEHVACKSHWLSEDIYGNIDENHLNSIL